MKRKIYLTVALGLILFTACETMKDPEVEYASTYPISGEYWVQYSHVDETKVNTFPFGKKFYTLDIFNTSANNGTEVWITDNPNSDEYDSKVQFWNYRVKIGCAPNNSTFGLASGDSVNNDIYKYSIRVGIYHGKIMKAISKQPSGTMTDSISFDLVFEDNASLSDAGDTIKVRGFRKTGFTDDAH